MRNRRWKLARPSSLSEAMQLCVEYAAENRKPVKVLADLMGVEIKTLYRWLSDTSMPINRVRQFETFCAVSFVSEYLCLAQGGKVVVAIPSGKKAGVADLSELQCTFAEAVALIARFYQDGSNPDGTVTAINGSLSQLAYQRGNVLKSANPELDLFGGAE